MLYRYFEIGPWKFKKHTSNWVFLCFCSSGIKIFHVSHHWLCTELWGMSWRWGGGTCWPQLACWSKVWQFNVRSAYKRSQWRGLGSGPPWAGLMAVRRDGCKLRELLATGQPDGSSRVEPSFLADKTFNSKSPIFLQIVLHVFYFGFKYYQYLLPSERL